MEWRNIYQNQYPKIILSDCKVDRLYIGNDYIKMDFLKDGFIVKDDINAWHNEDGILIIGIMEFLLNSNSLEL